MADNKSTRYYQFYDKSGKKFDVDANAVDNDMDGFAEAYPDVNMRMVDKDGEQWDIPVANMKKAMQEGGYRMWTWKSTPVKPKATAKEQPLDIDAKVGSLGSLVGTYRPTASELQGMQATINSASRTAGNVGEEFGQFTKNLQDYQKQKPLGRGIAKVSRMNPETYQMEDRYLTGEGTEHTSEYEAKDFQKAFEGDERKQLRRKADFADRELEKALAQREVLRYKDTNDPNIRQQVEDNEARIKELQNNPNRLRAAEMEIDNELADVRRAEEENSKRAEPKGERSAWDIFKENFAASMAAGMGEMGGAMPVGDVKHEMERRGAYGEERRDIANEREVLKARRRLAEEAKSLINDIHLDQKMNGWGLARAGLKVAETALNPNTWDWGKGELETNMAIAEAVIKADSGLGLSENEKKLLDTWAKSTAIQSQFGDQLSGWTKAGMVTGESLPFMLEMAMNPASGLGKAATEKVVQYSMRKAATRFLKEGVEKFGKEQGEKWAKRKGAEYLRNHMKGLVAKKMVTRGVGDITAGTLMASTSGQMRVAADALKRATGEVDIQMADNGDVLYNGIKADTKNSPAAAVLKALGNTTIENWSEMAGEYLGFLNDFFGKAIGRAVVGKKGRQALDVVGNVEGVTLNKAQKFIYELAAGKGIGAFSQGLSDFAKQTQWHGVMGEYLEEVIGNIANAATVGDMTFDTAENTGVFNLQQNIDTFCGVALMGGFMSALHTGGFIGHKINYDPERVSRQNEKLFGDELWGDVKMMIDNSYKDPRELNDAITYILRGESGNSYSEAQKKAVLKYTQAVLEKEGADMVDYQPRMVSSSVEEVKGEDGSKQWQVTSLDVNGDAITQQTFDTEDEAKAFEGELKMQQQKKDFGDYLNMSTKLSFAEASQAVDDFMKVMGVDENSEKYEEMLADINDPNTDLGKQFRQFKYDKVIEKARSSQDAIAAFEDTNGWERGTVKWLSEQNPLELDEEGLQMADQARNFLEGLAYPAGEVHVEHEQQVGAETGRAIVEEVVSTEEPIDPMNNAGQQLNDQWNAAQASRQAAFDNNESLKEEVERMEAMQLSPQEILSSLDSFRPEERQAMVDYYNTKARYDSMLDEAARQIDNIAHRDRERRTFKGSINGEPNVGELIKITDGENSYTLVSGDIQTDGDGQVTDSASGLIIGLDDSGDFVTLSDSNGLVVEVPQMTLDQYEEGRRNELQEQVTGVIVPNGAMVPAADAEGVVTGKAEQETQRQAEANAPDTVANIESVTDEDGVKRYENGIGVDDAIADMEADGLDVNEEADLAINEAQTELDKMKAPKTRAERAKNDKRRTELQKVVDYYNDVKKRYAELHPTYADATPFIDQINKATSKKKADEILNAALQAGVNPQEINPVHTQRVSDLIAKEEEARRLAEEVTPKDTQLTEQYRDTPDGRAWLLDKKRVQSYNKRRKLAKMIYGDLFDDDFDSWRDLRELISSWLSKGRNLDPDSFGEELGWDMGVGKDAAKVSTMFAKRRENGGDGMLFNDFVHMVAENSGGRFDTQEVRNELIAMFQEAQEKSDLTEWQLVSRIAEAEKHLQEEALRAEEAKDEDIEQEEQPIIDGGLPFAPPAIQQPLGMSEAEAEAIIASMKGHATVAPVVEITDENWQDNLATPVGNVKMGDHQKEKLFAKGREQQYGMLVETLTNPDIVLEEMDSEDSVFHERPSSYIFVKTFIKPDGTKYVHFESVTVSQDGMEVSISSHIIKESKLKDKLMDDKMLYKNESLSPNSSEWRLAEQQDAVPDLLPTQGDNVLDGKDRKKTDTKQENEGKSSEKDEYLTSHPLTEEQIMADAEATEDEKLNAIDFLRGEDDSAISQFYYDSIYERAQKTSSSENRQKKEENEPAKEKKEEKPQQPQPRWQYQFHYDKETGRAWITRDDWSGGVPIQDGRFRIEGNNLAELRAILENPKNNLGELLKEVEAQLHNAEVGEQIRKATTPTEAIEAATQAFREEQKSKDQKDIDDALKEFNDFLDNAKGSGVIDKFMRKGLEGNNKAQTNLFDMMTGTNAAQRSFLGDLLRLASKVGYAYIKSGVHDFQEWSKKMADSIGRKLQEVLGWDDALVNDFIGEVWEQKYTVNGERMRLREHAEKLKNSKGTDTAVNVNKKENNEAGNDVSLQEEGQQTESAGTLEGDSAEFAERQYKIEQLSKKIRAKLQGIVNWGDQQKPLSAYKQIAKELGIENLSDTDLQELIETEVVNLSREIANKEGLTDEKKFQKIVKLYEGQPSLNARDNDRINKQQYSTPAPMAYLMGRFVSPTLTRGEQWRGLEPSAGNGMLTIGLPKEKMHVNDIDEMRLSNLQKQGFGEVTSQDGTQPFDGKYDVIVTNPPFGSVTPKVYDGIYEISALEHQMAINALESMKDDGRAAIIIGGNTEYKTNGAVQGKDRVFLNYLYSHYNVVDVINMDGKTLYTKQGTGYPVRMILINGRKEFDPNTFAPVKSKARAEQVKSYDELYKRVSDDILSNENKSAGVHNAESGESNGNHDSRHGETSTQTGVRNVRNGGSGEQPSVLAPDGRGVQRLSGNAQSEERGDTVGEGSGLVDRPVSVLHTSGKETTQHEGSETSSAEPGGRGRSVASGGVDSERQAGESDVPVGVGQRGAGTSQPVQQPEQKRGLSTEKVPYKKQSSNPFTLDSLMPAEQADEVKKILEELGDVDQFLVDELGYSSKEELHRALAAEQIDSVAMAIHQMNQGNAFIIGDMTGIGKGRQAAALIRYGVKKGGCPVFITVKKGLFSDMYRDLCDIGSPELRPFIWCAKDKDKSQDITDADGNVVYKWSEKEQKRVAEYILKNGKLPPEYDYIVTTYDGFKSGTLDYENGQKKARNFGKGKSAGSQAINGQSKRDALEVLARNSYVIMDESHNAGGDKSNVSKYLQYITAITKGTTFLSATFAKRPENMPIYALRTAISKAGVKVDELIAAVKKGGATFQEVMSKALTGAGQMIRRERNMEGVTIDWKGIEDEDIIQKQREQYDTIIGLFNDIINFQRTYVDPIVNGMNDAEAEVQGSVDHTPGTRDMGINNTPFASRTYNMVQQVLLSLKAEEAGKRAVEHLKAGRKPVIAVANTNEGAADEAVGMSEEDLEMPDLSINLKKGLQGTLRITKKDAFGNETNEMIPFERLSEEGQRRYAEIMDAIESASSGLSLSPIDVIKNELKKAGYKVGELTGRKAEFVYNSDGTVKRVKRTDTDKKKTAANFNNGTLDALIINRSAGTGISLHASSRFKDQRQRIMIVAQAQGDVNDEVQMRGRIDRTGQVLRGMYEYVVSQIPSEQRLLMMLKAKLRSLDANTTSSQKSKFNEMQVQDIINKYGDDIVIQYLSEHPDLAVKMVDPLKWGDSLGEGYETMSSEVLVTNAKKQDEQGQTASKVLGRMALLTVKEQEKMLAEIGDLYQAEIDRLNEMGENDLEITEMPLAAKTISKSVWEEGIEPGGKNPFADSTYVEKVNMAVLKKPMKGEEVKRSQERLLSGKTWEDYKRDILSRVDKWAEQKKAETTETITERAKKKAEAEKEKYIKGAKKAQEKNGMTDEEIEKNGGYQYDTFYKQEMEKLDAALAGIEAQKQVFIDALELFNTDNVYAIPSNIYDLGSMTFEPGFGKLIDIKISDNFSTAASTITFATLDGRRKITVPISGKVKQQNNEKREIFPVINTLTAQTKNGMFGSNVANTLKVLEQNVDNWDKLTSTAARKDGYIITGNLLKALVSTREQGVGGKLISYTTDTGEVRQGILMPDNFEPAGLTSKTPISSKKDELRWRGDKITSADGDVTIKKDYGHWYTLTVPKSKKKGEKYFNDEVLLSLVNNNSFEGSTKLSAGIAGENIDAVFKRLDELGVTVEEEHKEDNNSQSSLSNRQESDEPIEKVVPLERKSLKSYKNGRGTHIRGIEETLAGLESDIARAGGSGSEVRESGQEVQSSDVNALRQEAERLRAEIARREKLRDGLRKKYHINEKGDVGLDDLARLFRDLNTDEATGELFEKVYDILKDLGVSFRFTDNLAGNTHGEAHAFFNVTFYNWDSMVRGRSNQDKAGTLLHEMIHNVASHILYRYEKPSLGKLTPEQERLAKELHEIFDIVKAYNLRNADGTEPYGTRTVHEMLSELGDPEFRSLLDNIPYYGKGSVWKAIKNWFRKLINRKESNVSSRLNKALEGILDTYDAAGISEYRQQRDYWEQEYSRSGKTLSYMDGLESILGNGHAQIVDDPEEIARLENEPAEKGYRTVVQNPDGTFGSPMAGRLGGKKGEKSKATSAYKMNEWEQAEENPQLATDNGKINLIKPGGLGTVGNVDYNPYIHIRENKLNKQFKNAWERPDLVYIEVAYPKSELSSGYKAEKAAKTVGRHKWPGGDLILSRWDKPVRIVPWEEVADDWEKEFGKRGVEFDIVSPHLLPILVERGVEILPPHKGMGDECKKAYERFKAEYDADPLNSMRRAAREFGRKQAEEPEVNTSGVVVDPMEVIRRAAEQFRNQQTEREEGIKEISESVKEQYTKTLDKESYIWTEAWQDSMLALKVFQNAAVKEGEEIADSQNAYMFENLMHGKSKNEMDLYNVEHRDPLMETVKEIIKRMGWTMRDMNKYLITKSGFERNRELFVRDWFKAERNKPVTLESLSVEEKEEYEKIAIRLEERFEDGDITAEQKEAKLAQAVKQVHKNYLDRQENKYYAARQENYEKLQSGDITFKEYIDELDSYISMNFDGYRPGKKDYSGFTEMFGDEEGDYDEKEIMQQLLEDEKLIGNDLLDKLWEQINGANRYALERYREAGMRSDEELDKIERMFNFYVPMRGFDSNTGEDMYQYLTSNNNVNSYVGGLIKAAKGRESMAKSPLSTMFGMSYKAITDCNQNLMLQRFYRFCQAHPNDLTVLSDAWVKWDDVKDQWEETWPEIPEDATEEQVRQATLDYEREMKELAKEGKAKKVHGKADIDYKPIEKRHKDEHTVEVRINGQKKLITVIGNPRLAQALNGHTRWENGKNILSKVNANIKGKMSSAFTSYSPTFAARNMLRDWTHFRMMLSVREGEGYAKTAVRYYKETFPRPWHKKGKMGMVKLFKKYRNGTLDMSNEIERDFKDFMDNGGVTGYVQMQKIDKMEKELRSLIGDRSGSEKILDKAKYWLVDNLHLQGAINVTDKVWNAVIGLVEAYNEAVENNARFATFRASRHYAGRTKARSAYDAKEITVNFNRKGSGAKARTLKDSRGEVSLAAEAAGLTSQVVGEGRIFNNATVQAIATTFKNFRNQNGSLNLPYIRKWAMRYATPPFMLGLALPYINMALAAMIGGDDDDDNPYANLPEWTRRKNLCIYVGNNNFITIPIGQELAAFLSLGDIVAGMTYDPELRPVNKDWLDEVESVLTTFSPIDLDTKMTDKEGLAGAGANVTGRLFSVLAPVVAIGENVGWNGRAIYMEDKYQNDEFEPEYKRVYQSTNPLLVKASKYIHELGGGNDNARGREWSEINPGVVQYLWEQYTGGPGKVFSNAISLGKDAGDLIGQLRRGENIDTDFNIRKVEGVKAFVQQGDDRTKYYRIQSKYYNYEREANKFKHDHDISNLEKQAKHDPMAKIELDSLQKGVDYARYAIIKEANSSNKKIGKVGMDDLRREINKITDRKEKRKRQNTYNELMKEVVKKLDNVQNMETAEP